MEKGKKRNGEISESTNKPKDLVEKSFIEPDKQLGSFADIKNDKLPSDKHWAIYAILKSSVDFMSKRKNFRVLILLAIFAILVIILVLGVILYGLYLLNLNDITKSVLVGGGLTSLVLKLKHK